MNIMEIEKKQDKEDYVFQISPHGGICNCTSKGRIVPFEFIPFTPPYPDALPLSCNANPISKTYLANNLVGEMVKEKKRSRTR